jgi:AFG3 family protein
VEENKNISPEKQTPKPQVKLNPDNKPSYVWIYIVMAVLTGVLVLQGVFTDSENREVYRTQFDKMYIDGDISQIKTINGKKALILIYPDSFNKKKQYDTFRKKKNTLEEANTSFFMYISSHSSLEQHIKELRKQYKLKEVELIPMMETGTWYGSFFNLFGPILLLIAFYFFMMRKMGGGGGGFPGGGIFSIGKSKATMVDKDAESDINFSSVAGLG